MTYDTLVLSGNGTNALATLGAIQRLFDAKVISQPSISSYYGTSSGSIIATLLAIGFEPLEILSHVCVHKSYAKVMSGLNLSFAGGLLNFDLVERELDNIIVSQLGYLPTMSGIKQRFGKSLTFVTYNLSTNKKEYVNSETYPDILVTKAIRMSSTFPVVFPPYEYEGSYYLDGGIVENLPMLAAQNGVNRCLGIYNINPPKPYSTNMTYFELLGRLLTTMTSSLVDAVHVYPGSKILKLSFSPSFFNFSSTSFELIKIFDSGYDVCSQTSVN